MNMLSRCAEHLHAVETNDESADRPSRRSLLTGAALLGAAFGRSAMAQQSAPSELVGGIGNQPPAGPILRLVKRITMGLTEEELNFAESLGYDEYLEYQLDYEAIDDSALDDRLSVFETLGLEARELAGFPPNQVITELVSARIWRSTYSKRQLFERMVDFWTDHFNITLPNALDIVLKPVDDREVIRQHALGFFPAMLWDSAHSPAMLFYLDNHTNVRGRPNENYARELMELHTLDVDNGYSQEDVEEVARCFTGWTIKGRDGEDYLKFLYNGNQHDQGEKLVLGQIIPANGGIRDAEIVLDILANHPNTARFISEKLSRWLWGYEPPEALVQRVADTYLATGGDIKAMVRTILQPLWLTQAPRKYKRPYHLMISGLRGVIADIVSPSGLFSSLSSVGQIPFYWGSPDGYPDDLDYWVGLILPRWNFGSSLMSGKLRGITADMSILNGEVKVDRIAERIDALLFGGHMAARDKQSLMDFMLPNNPGEARVREAFGLAISSPGFQWY